MSPTYVSSLSSLTKSIHGGGDEQTARTCQRGREPTFEIFFAVLVGNLIRNFLDSLEGRDFCLFRLELEDTFADLVELRRDELAPESQERGRDFRVVETLEMRRHHRESRMGMGEVGVSGRRIGRAREGDEGSSVVLLDELETSDA